MYSVPGEYIELESNPVGSNWLTCEINETENTNESTVDIIAIMSSLGLTYTTSYSPAGRSRPMFHPDAR